MKTKITKLHAILFVSIIAVLLMNRPANAQPVITLNAFSSPYTYPVGIFNSGDERLFIIEQLGRIYICDLNGVKNTVPFLDIHTIVNQSVGEQGLLGMAFHPNYGVNGYVYVNYTDNSGNTKISRFTRNSTNINRLDETTELLIMSIAQPYANHNGGCINFGKDGYLYIGMGDGGSAGDPGARAQNNLEKLGKMLRIDVNSGSPYSIPASNPYYGSIGSVQEIWAKGLRNPWRWTFDSYSGDMWIGDVGQYLYEEINFQPANSSGGENYGWRCYEGNHSYDLSVNCPAASALTFPVYEYTHGSVSGCSVTGGYVYRGGRNGELFGKYIFSDYCSGLMRMIEKTGSSTFVETDLNDQPNNEIVSFGEDKNREIYVCYYNSGAIKKLSSAGCAPTAFIKGGNTVTPCANTTLTLEAIYGAGLTYRWFKNNILISGATSASYATTTNGNFKVEVTKTGGCSAISNVVNVKFIPSANITSSGPTTFCAGSNVVLSALTGPGYTYQWKKNNVNISGATGSAFTATQAGKYKVKTTSASGCTKLSNIVTVTVNCKISETTQVENLTAEIIPNPATAIVNINISGLPDHQYKVMLYDMLGKKISTWNIVTGNDGLGSQTVDVSEFYKGVYNIIIEAGWRKEYRKLIIQ